MSIGKRLILNYQEKNFLDGDRKEEKREKETTNENQLNSFDLFISLKRSLRSEFRIFSFFGYRMIGVENSGTEGSDVAF